MKEILIIEDNIANVSPFINILHKNYRVEATGFLATARYKLQKNPKKYSLIILDLMMPPEIYEPSQVQDGLRTGYQFYKDYVEGLDVPVIIWTADASIQEEKDKVWGKDVHFLIKNSDHEHLLKFVNQILEK